MTGNSRSLTNVGHGVNDLYWFVIPSMLPVILEQYRMSYGSAGGILTAFLGTIAVFSFLLGRFSDRVPRPIMMGAGFLFASALLMLSTAAEKLPFFVICVLAAGIGVSSYHPAGYASIADTPPDRRGAAYGYFELWGSGAVFGMFLLHGLLLREIEWRSIILITAVPGLIMGLLFFVFAGRFKVVMQSGPVADVKGFARGSLPGYFFFLFLAVITFRFFGIMAIVSFTPTYLVREIGLTASVASFATGIYFLGGLIFTPILGIQCDRRGPFPVLLATTAAAFPLIFLLSLPQNPLLIPVWLFLIGICYYGAGPAMDLIVSRISGSLGMGEAFGYFMAMVAVAFSFSPLLFGILADHTGLRVSVQVFSFALLLSTCVLLVIMALMKLRGRRAADLAGREEAVQ
jgi:FSR family fosmidomycin resistance protein-like MFS transporter